MKTYIGSYNMQHDHNALYTFTKALEIFVCASVALLTSVRYQRGFQGCGRLTMPTVVLFFSYFLLERVTKLLKIQRIPLKLQRKCAKTHEKDKK